MKAFLAKKWEPIRRFYKEIELQLRIRFGDGRRELEIYRLERNMGMSLIWAPSKGTWVRARALRWGSKYVHVQFVDGAEKEGFRSPLSIRARDPRKRGMDDPFEDARYSGNSGWHYGPDGISKWFTYFLNPQRPNPGATMEEIAAALRTLVGG